MYRAAPFLFLSLILPVVAVSAPPPDAKETTKNALTADDFKKAIAELGSQRYAVRERAKKLLADAGSAAGPFLEEAAKSSDEEISNSAKAILEKLQWGLSPETPKEVRDLIELFRSGLPEQRQQAIANLLKLKPIPFPTIRRLLSKEENEELREQMFVNWYQRVREMIPDLLARGELDTAEEMFEVTLLGSPSLMAQDYAAFMYLRGKLDAAIARFEKQRKQKGEAGQHAAEVLVYLYRNKADWPASRRAAADSKKDELVELVLWQASDWKALAADPHPADRGNILGLAAAYARLAGNKKDFDEKIADIKKTAEDSMDEDGTLRLASDALLLNGKSSDAIKILSDRKRELALTFDLLCSQMKYKEAFDLVDEARRRDTDPQERNGIEIRRARMLYLLGEKDAATQIFGKVAGEIVATERMDLARDLIKAEVRVGLRELACDHAAKFIEQLTQVGQNGVIQLLEPIFGDDKNVAQTWFNLFRREAPKEGPAAAMKRVGDILAGKLDKKELDKCIDQIVKNPRFDNDPNVRRRGMRTRFQGLDAVAAAYRAIADDAKTEEYLKKAAEKYPTSARWIVHGDFLTEKKKYKEAAESYAKAAKSARLPGQNIEIDGDVNGGDLSILMQDFGPALPTYLQGRALLSAGDAKEGRRLIELAHWLPLGNEVVGAHLVEELNKRDWTAMARQEAEFMLKTGWYSDYSYGNVLSFLAKQSSKEKNYFKAAEYYEKCLVGCLRTGASFVETTAYLLVPESVRVYRARGYLAKGEIDKAEREAVANLEVMPGNVDIAIKLVPELEKAGKKKEADAIYEKVRGAWEKLSKDYPSSAFAHNSAAWIMALCRRDLDTALKHAQKAVEVEPKNAGYLDTLAEVYFRKGDRDKALSFMKKCVELDPKHSYYRKQLVRFKDQPLDSSTPEEEDEED